jgi:large subunit ribosomal protein L17
MKRTLRAQSDFRLTLLRNQLTSLVLFESVTTTQSKAKSLIAFANEFFNRARSADLNAKRYAAATLFDKNAVKKVFEELLPRYNNAETTFVRHFRVIPRKGDSAAMAMVSLIKPFQIKEKTAKAEAVSKATAKDKPVKSAKKVKKQ